MPETKARRLAMALDAFISSSPDVEAAAVVSFDGLPMASALPDSMEEDRVGAMSAALLSLGEQAAIGLGRGQLNQVFVEGEYGYVFLMSARDQAVLAAVARHSAKIGFMLFEMRRAAEDIGDVLLSSEDRQPEAASPLDDLDFEQQPADHAPTYDEPTPQEPAYQEPAYQEPTYQEAAQQEPARQESADNEPAPWNSGLPEEHDLSAAPSSDAPAPDEDRSREEFRYRPDADHSAAPWH